MTAASLIGFGAVFLLTCGAASAALGALVLGGRGLLARRGAAVERRAAELAALLPLAIAAAVVAILVIESLAGIDHCATHDHHDHLCLRHGAAWARNPIALVAVACGCAAVIARVVMLVASLIRGAAVLRSLRGMSRRIDGGVELVESERAFCFVAGIRRGTIVASSAARAQLSDEEWAAMIAHEAGHVRTGDLARRLWLDLALVFAAPLVGAVLRDRWDDATERLRDADAADAVGSPEVVAGALVHMARCNTATELEHVAAFTRRGGQLAARITALLDEQPRGEATARRLARWLGAGCAGVIVAACALAEPLHHALETLLG